jgi:hypothetical protein
MGAIAAIPISLITGALGIIVVGLFPCKNGHDFAGRAVLSAPKMRQNHGFDLCSSRPHFRKPLAGKNIELAGAGKPQA